MTNLVRTKILDEDLAFFKSEVNEYKNELLSYYTSSNSKKEVKQTNPLLRLFGLKKYKEVCRKTPKHCFQSYDYIFEYKYIIDIQDVILLAEKSHDGYIFINSGMCNSIDQLNYFKEQYDENNNTTA